MPNSPSRRLIPKDVDPVILDNLKRELQVDAHCYKLPANTRWVFVQQRDHNYHGAAYYFCRSCPALVKCYQYWLLQLGEWNNDVGVWAGTGPSHRKRLPLGQLCSCEGRTKTSRAASCYLHNPPPANEINDFLESLAKRLHVPEPRDILVSVPLPTTHMRKCNDD